MCILSNTCSVQSFVYSEARNILYASTQTQMRNLGHAETALDIHTWATENEKLCLTKQTLHFKVKKAFSFEHFSMNF